MRVLTFVQEAEQRHVCAGGANGWCFNACTVMWCVVCMGELCLLSAQQYELYLFIICMQIYEVAHNGASFEDTANN